MKTDLDIPIPYRLRVDPPSAEMRAFVVPAGVQRFFTSPRWKKKSGVRSRATG